MMKPAPQNSSARDFFPSILIFILIASIPELFAFFISPPGKVFTGSLVNPDDLNTYLAAIRQGYEGNWLFTPPFSPEPIPDHLAYIPYLLVGHLLGLFRLRFFYTGYQILRFASLGFSFFAFGRLVKTLFPQNRVIQQRIFEVLLFAGGGGWLFVAFLGPNSPFTPDLITPEWNLFLNFLASPHFLLGIGFESLLIRELILLAKKMDWGSVVKVALLGTGLGLTYPFLIPVIGLTIAWKLAVETFRSRKIPTIFFIKALIGSLPMIGFLIYYGIILPQNIWYQQTMLQNNAIAPPNPIGLLLGFSFLLIPSVLGFSMWVKSKLPAVFPIWILANTIALYLPFSFSGRFLTGMFIPLSIMAVYGVQHIGKTFPVTSSTPDRRFNFYFLLLLPGNLVILLFLLKTPQNTRDFPIYIPETEIQALVWLGKNTTSSDLVLAEYPIGSIAPRYIPAKVFIGHLNLTVDLADKRNQVLSFWNESSSSDERLELINRWGITYVYQGLYEKNISGKEITPPGDLVYKNQDVSIYSESADH